MARDAAAQAAQVRAAELDAQRTAEGVVGFDDARLDEHLAHRDVHLGDQRLHFLELARDVVDEDLVGARLGNHRAARGEQPRVVRHTAATGAALALRLAEQLGGHVAGLGVVELERLRARGLELGDLLLRFQVDLFLGRQLFLGGDPQHVAVLAHAQALALQDDVQRLVPGHVLQPQGHAAGHGIAGHDVEVGEVGDHLKQRADLDVLEVQAQFLALEALALCQLVRVDLHRPHFEHELVVALVGTVFPRAGGLDHHAHAVAALERGDALHGGAEIGDVEPAAQRIRQRGAQELDDQRLPLLADVHAHLRARQADDDAPGAVAAAAEIDVLERLRGRVQRGCELRRLLGAGHGRPGDIEHQQQRLALQLGAVARGLLEVEHQARAVTGLRHAHRTQVALVDLDAVAAQGVGHAGQVDGDARRRLHREAVGDGGQRFGKLDAHDLGARLLAAGDRLDRVLCPGRERREHCACGGQSGCGGSPVEHGAGLLLFPHRAFSCNCSVAGRSIHSPAASCTISRSAISVSAIRVMRP